MRSLDYFAAHPVFTHSEFLAAHTVKGRSPSTSNGLLRKHLASGHLLRIRRGLYASLPRGANPKQAVVDPYLIASHLVEDAVIAYHAALQFFGKSYSVWQRFQYGSGKRARTFVYRNMEFIPVFWASLVETVPLKDNGILTVDHAGEKVRVTSLERTMVDVFHAPEKGGGWEEIWQSLEMIEYFDVDAVLRHTHASGSALTASRVGFYLEQHRDSLMLEDKHLKPFEKLASLQPRYLDGRRQPGKLAGHWNLIVPDYIQNKRWEDASG